MERTLKIFISCALGAGIGTMVSSEINGYFWWLGLLAGGLIGYLSYEFRAVIAAAQRAWYEVISWRPDKELWKLRFRGLFWFASMATTIIIAVMLAIILIFWGELKMSPQYWKDFGLAVVVVILFLSGIGFSFSELMFEKSKSREMWIREINDIKPFNPLSVYFYYLPIGIWWCLKRMPFATRAAIKGLILGLTMAARFIKIVFVLIHSEIRLLCGVDAAIGAAIGYFAGSVLIGMIAGGIVGILNYEIISRRILHLAPLKST